jgi:hypothetical protein
VARVTPVGVAELAAYEDDVDALGEEHRGEAVAERVERQPFTRGRYTGAFQGSPEPFADGAVVEPASFPRGEHQVGRRLEGGAVAVLAEESCDGGGENEFIG